MKITTTTRPDGDGKREVLATLADVHDVGTSVIIRKPYAIIVQLGAPNFNQPFDMSKEDLIISKD